MIAVIAVAIMIYCSSPFFSQMWLYALFNRSFVHVTIKSPCRDVRVSKDGAETLLTVCM